jgi:hypothetical protein
MTEINLIDDFYLPYKKQEESYASKEYRLLLDNDVDPAKIIGLEPNHEAGVITLGKEIEGQKESLFNETIDFIGSIPKDMAIGAARGTVNGFDFIKDAAEAITYGNTLTPDDSIFKFLEEKVNTARTSLDSFDKDDPLVAKMIGTIGQDAAYVYPIHKKLKSIGIPKQYALPLAFAVGSTLAFENKSSFLLDTETINGLKSAINLKPDTPAEEMFDKLVQFVEFSGMGFAFNKIAPIFRSLKNIDVQKASTVTAGSAAAGAAAIEVQDNIQNNIISEQTEKE